MEVTEERIEWINSRAEWESHVSPMGWKGDKCFAHYDVPQDWIQLRIDEPDADGQASHIERWLQPSTPTPSSDYSSTDEDSSSDGLANSDQPQLGRAILRPWSVTNLDPSTSH